MLTRTLFFSLLVLVTAVAAACGGTGNESSGDGDSKLSLVAYSTPKEAYGELVPAFNKTSAGRGVTVDQSYGASGEQTRAVQGGLPTDVVTLSLAPDMDKLVESGEVAKTWTDTPTKGFVTNSVVVFVTRKGNPKNVKTWDDLLKKDVEVITPNPVTSGGARWNVMAAYGAQLEQGKSEQEGVKYLETLLNKVPVQDKSARESLQTFQSGKGDVLLAYENEAILAKKKGLDVDYTIPAETLLIQNPIAVAEQAPNKAKGKAFVDFLTGEEGQRVFASQGYRPVLKSAEDPKQFPTPKQLFTIEKLGGWPAVVKKFFDEENGQVTKINEKAGQAAE
jgi:sulfate/thiosulfate transport system substrate-binding protein